MEAGGLKDCTAQTVLHTVVQMTNFLLICL